ncbi:MAG: hypothetical protein QHI48_03330 [Bacteroidota bacterium]|nr:hypothetical protein [Bacteroidota bacterium]
MRHSPSVVLGFLLVVFGTARAQFQFNMDQFVAPENAYGKVTIPANTWAEIVQNSSEGISPAEACLAPSTPGFLAGYQADYDGDGSEEMWLLYKNTASTPPCNVLAVIKMTGQGTQRLLDVLPLPAGEALIRPIHTLNEGVQMYAQCTYTLPDGAVESQGIILGLRESSIVIYISWTQKSGFRDGIRSVQVVKAALSDINYDNRKELFLDFRTHEPGNGPLKEKNMTDRYILTLDYLPNHLRYGVYDSTGFDKVQQASTLAKSGERLLGKASTRDEGVVKIREALRLNPFLTETRVKLGKFFLNLGKYSDAEKTLLVAREFDSSYPKTHKLLGDTYLRLNDMQKALECYQRYLSMIPKDLQTLDARQARINVNRITVWRRK